MSQQPSLFLEGDPIALRIHRAIEVPKDPLPEECVQEFKKLLTYRNPKYDSLRRLGKWTGDTPTTVETWEEDRNNLYLPRGRGPDVVEHLSKFGFYPVWTDDRSHGPEVVIQPSPRADPITLRKDQQRCVDAILDQPTCLIRAAAGMGKTEVGLEVILRLGVSTLIVVWSKGLFKQWHQRICNRWGWKPDQVGLIGGGKYRIRPVTIAMQQSLRNRITQLSDQFGLVICDEVQRFAAPTFREAISLLSAYRRVGLSEDERRKDRMHMLIHDHFGKPVAEVRRHELIARGDLCEVEIIMVPTDVEYPDLKLDEAPPKERGRLVGQHWTDILNRLELEVGRNDLIAELMAKEVKARWDRGHGCVVFTDRKEHARDIAKRVAIHYEVPCGLALGGDPSDQQVFDETVERLSTGDLRCCVATSAMYQGQDIPMLTVGIVGTPTATNPQLLSQQIGRLRRKFPGKTKGRLIYIWDSKLFPSHPAALRRQYGRRLVRTMEPDEVVALIERGDI